MADISLVSRVRTRRKRPQNSKVSQDFCSAEPGGGREREIRLQSVPSLQGKRVGRQTRCLVSVLTKRLTDSIKKGQFILNLQIYAQRVPLRIHRCAGVEMYGFHGRRDRLCVTAASKNSQEN